MPILRDLLHGAAIDRPVAIVAAHPDDEVLALGGRLDTFRALRIIHLTDGAPRDLADARRAGCPDAAAYAALRRGELRAALAAAGAEAELRPYGYPDQGALEHAKEIVARLADDLAAAEAVFTHPYEGGHPDHDTAALATSLALARLADAGRAAPTHWEFPSYHARGGGGAFGVFWPDPAAPEAVLPLTEARRARKRAALACFASQACVIAPFPLEPERLRPAPAYDFAAAPPPGAALYDGWGWAITSREWRRAAGALRATAA